MWEGCKESRVTGEGYGVEGERKLKMGWIQIKHLQEHRDIGNLGAMAETKHVFFFFRLGELELVVGTA